MLGIGLGPVADGLAANGSVSRAAANGADAGAGPAQ
jgi:hypothetical protein